MKFQNIVLLCLSINLVSCNSSDNGLSDSEKIGLFIDSIAFQSSEDNLVTSIGYEDASLVLKFESNQSESIAQDLVSYELSNFYAKLVFNDSREAEVALINAQISMTAITSIDSNVPLSKKFEVDGGLGLISSKLTLQGPIKKDTSSFILSGRRTYIDVLV